MGYKVVEKRELKYVRYNGIKYGYLEYETYMGETFFSTTLIQIPIKEDYLDIFWFDRERRWEKLYKTVEENEVDKLTIISTNTGGYPSNPEVYYIFEKGLEIVNIIVEDSLGELEYVIVKLRENEDIVGKFKIENSLSLVGDRWYGELMEGYSDPGREHLSGLEYRGYPIMRGASFRLYGLATVVDLLDEDLLMAVEECGVNALRVDTKDTTGVNHTLINVYALKDDGEYFTNLDFEMAVSGAEMDALDFIKSEVRLVSDEHLDYDIEEVYEHVSNYLVRPYKVSMGLREVQEALNTEGMVYQKVTHNFRL